MALDEFLTSYADNSVLTATANIWWKGTDLNLGLNFWSGETSIDVRSKSRGDIEAVFSIFEDAPPEDRFKFERKKAPRSSQFLLGMVAITSGRN